MKKAFGEGCWNHEVRTAIIEACLRIKGRADSMGYQLLARILDSLCNFSEHITELQEQQYIIVRKHLEALNTIVVQRIDGDGGKVGTSLCLNLQKLITKLS